jgi:Uma2 family endonuclease
MKRSTVTLERVPTTYQIPLTTVQEPEYQPEPYPYGWRYVTYTLPNGEQEWERVPLTLEDVLHPQEEDVMAHSDEHKLFCIYLHNVIIAQLIDDPHAFVLHDTLIAWGHPSLAPHAPDIAVIFNVRQWQDWGTFDTIAEGSKPTLVIEVTSPKTRSLDLNKKPEQYKQLGVPFIVIVDRAKGKKRTKPRLLGYQLTPTGYVSMKPNQEGWLWLEPVKLWLALHSGQIACYDQSGRLKVDYKGLVGQLQKAKTEVQTEREQRLQAESKVEVERSQRLEAESKVEVERSQRLQAESKVEVERSQRLAAEDELARLRAKLAKLQGSSSQSE